MAVSRLPAFDQFIADLRGAFAACGFGDQNIVQPYARLAIIGVESLFEQGICNNPVLHFGYQYLEVRSGSERIALERLVAERKGRIHEPRQFIAEFHQCGHVVGPRRPYTDTAHINRDCATAASMNDVNSGCGSKGFDFSSGWNCTPMNHG